MLDIELIRAHPDIVVEGLNSLNDWSPNSIGWLRGWPATIEWLLELDSFVRASRARLQYYQTERRKEAGKDGDREWQLYFREAVTEAKEYLADKEADLEKEMLDLPNLPHPDAPGAPQGRYREIIEVWGGCVSCGKSGELRRVRETDVRLCPRCWEKENGAAGQCAVCQEVMGNA